MKKGLIFSLLTAAISSLVIVWQGGGLEIENKNISFVNVFKEGEEESRSEQVSHLAAIRREELQMLVDPKTGKIPKNIFRDEMIQAMSLPVSLDPRSVSNGVVRAANGVNTPTSNVYQKAGPNNIGGRTRAFVFDKRYNGTTNKVIISGCVSGGIMRSADGGTTWDLVTPSQQIHSLTTLAQDTRAGFENTWYAGTGEALGNSAGREGASFLGNGIFKSTDNGLTWNALTSTQTGSLTSFDSEFDIIHKIAVHPITGDVYVACQGTISRSQNGGTSWTNIIGSIFNTSNAQDGNTDVVITNNGSKVYVSFHLKNSVNRGVWESTTGNAGSFQAIAGNTAGIPTGFKQNTGSSSWGRIVMALAPSNNNILYVFYENGESQKSPNFKPEGDLFKMEVISGVITWTNLSANMPNMPGNNKNATDPISLSGGYVMLLSVKPDNPNVVYIGGTNLYRSTSGFTNSTNTTWIGGYDTDFTYNLYPESHADMHGLLFDPTNNNRAFCFNDGGIQVTEDITATNVTWKYINNYQTLQYYFVSIDPETGKNNFMGGAQDNSIQYRDASFNFFTRPPDNPAIDDHIDLFGGDGMSVDISKINAGKQYFYLTNQSGTIYRLNLTINTTFSYTNIMPDPTLTELISDGDGGYGSPYTYMKLSNANSEVLFYTNYYNLFRTTAASSVDSSKWTNMTGVGITTNTGGATPVTIRTMDFSWGPYTTSHVMYYGTNNGKLFRLNDYANAQASTIPVDISPSGIAGNISDIAVNPNDDNEIMVVVSNYNVTSIWWTWNAKSATPSWSNVEGNLTLPSLSSCAIVVKKEGGIPISEYYVGTSVGLYTTASIGKTMGTGGSGSVVWSREAANILNYAVIRSLDYRPEDNTLLIGTHGNGMYYSVIGSPNFTPNIATAIAAPIVNDKNFVRVYPTVSTGNYQYGQGTITGIKSMQIQVYNMAGQPVYQNLVNYGSGNIPLSNLPAGTYVVQITSDNKKYQTLQKVIKQ